MASRSRTVPTMTTLLATVLATIALGTGPATGPLEDQPGWDCHTMGNRICGEIATGPNAYEEGQYVGGYN